MNITYTWKISGMKMAPALDGLTDVITNIQFEYKGTDAESGYSSSFMGAIPIGQPNPDSFTPLADLTEDEVIEWVKSVYDMTHPNEVILKEIQNKITPKDKEAPMSWAPAPTPPPPAE
jgi:hypothetical protein